MQWGDGSGTPFLDEQFDYATDSTHVYVKKITEPGTYQTEVVVFGEHAVNVFEFPIIVNTAPIVPDPQAIRVHVDAIDNPQPTSQFINTSESLNNAPYDS